MLRSTSMCLCSCLFVHFTFATFAFSQIAQDSAEYKTHSDVAYRVGGELTTYQRERCRLDVYCPVKVKGKGSGESMAKGFATVVWFHGGGLTSGSKSIPKPLKEKGVAVVAVNYRLSPKVQSPAYVDDAAASVAWTIKHIDEYGGDPRLVFVSGHSAGGYLTSMIGLDKTYLKKYEIDADRLAGLVPFSGHTITHFTVRKERGIDGKQPIVDRMAPLFHVRKDCPPILFITGDRKLEMLGRYEENAYMWRMMQVVGHAEAGLNELEGYNHGQMDEPAYPLLLRFIKKRTKSILEASVAAP